MEETGKEESWKTVGTVEMLGKCGAQEQLVGMEQNLTKTSEDQNETKDHPGM